MRSFRTPRRVAQVPVAAADLVVINQQLNSPELFVVGKFSIPVRDSKNDSWGDELCRSGEVFTAEFGSAAIAGAGG